MNARKPVLTGLLLAALLISLWPAAFAASGEAQQSPYKIHMILWRGVTEAEKGFMEYFTRKQLPVEFLIRDCNRDRTKIQDFVEEIKQSKPDLVYTFGTTISRRVAGTWYKDDETNEITEIPVVFNIVANPVRSKIVNSFDSSGRNVTGTSHLAPISSQVAAIRSIVELKRLAVLFNPQENNSVEAVKTLQQLADTESFQLFAAPIPINQQNQPELGRLPSVLDALQVNKPQLVYLPSDSLIISNAATIVAEIHKRNIPTFSATEGPIRQAGATFGLVARYYNVGRFAAYKAEQILFKKVDPRDIPIETLKRFSLLINMESALEHRFYPPISVLKIAEVINVPDREGE